MAAQTIWKRTLSFLLTSWGQSFCPPSRLMRTSPDPNYSPTQPPGHWTVHLTLFLPKSARYTLIQTPKNLMSVATDWFNPIWYFIPLSNDINYPPSSTWEDTLMTYDYYNMRTSIKLSVTWGQPLHGEISENSFMLLNRITDFWQYQFHLYSIWSKLGSANV